MIAQGNSIVSKARPRWVVSADFQIFLGLLGNGALVAIFSQLTLFSSDERQYRLMRRVIVIALVTLLAVFRVVRRGTPRQRFIAAVLCVLPLLCLVRGCFADWDDLRS